MQRVSRNASYAQRNFVGVALAKCNSTTITIQLHVKLNISHVLAIQATHFLIDDRGTLEANEAKLVGRVVANEMVCSAIHEIRALSVA